MALISFGSNFIPLLSRGEMLPPRASLHVDVIWPHIIYYLFREVGEQKLNVVSPDLPED